MQRTTSTVDRLPNNLTKIDADKKLTLEEILVDIGNDVDLLTVKQLHLWVWHGYPAAWLSEILSGLPYVANKRWLASAYAKTLKHKKISELEELNQVEMVGKLGDDYHQYVNQSKAKNKKKRAWDIDVLRSKLEKYKDKTPLHIKSKTQDKPIADALFDAMKVDCETLTVRHVHQWILEGHTAAYLSQKLRLVNDKISNYFRHHFFSFGIKNVSDLENLSEEEAKALFGDFYEKSFLSITKFEVAKVSHLDAIPRATDQEISKDDTITKLTPKEILNDIGCDINLLTVKQLHLWLLNGYSLKALSLMLTSDKAKLSNFWRNSFINKFGIIKGQQLVALTEGDAKQLFGEKYDDFFIPSNAQGKMKKCWHEAELDLVIKKYQSSIKLNMKAGKNEDANIYFDSLKLTKETITIAQLHQWVRKGFALRTLESRLEISKIAGKWARLFVKIPQMRSLEEMSQLSEEEARNLVGPAYDECFYSFKRDHIEPIKNDIAKKSKRKNEQRALEETTAKKSRVKSAEKNNVTVIKGKSKRNHDALDDSIDNDDFVSNAGLAEFLDNEIERVSKSKCVSTQLPDKEKDDCASKPLEVAPAYLKAMPVVEKRKDDCASEPLEAAPAKTLKAMPVVEERKDDCASKPLEAAPAKTRKSTPIVEKRKDDLEFESMPDIVIPSAVTTSSTVVIERFLKDKAKTSSVPLQVKPVALPDYKQAGLKGDPKSKIVKPHVASSISGPDENLHIDIESLLSISDKVSEVFSLEPFQESHSKQVSSDDLAAEVIGPTSYEGLELQPVLAHAPSFFGQNFLVMPQQSFTLMPEHGVGYVPSHNKPTSS